jgi:hypothetical protein
VAGNEALDVVDLLIQHSVGAVIDDRDLDNAARRLKRTKLLAIETCRRAGAVFPDAGQPKASDAHDAAHVSTRPAAVARVRPRHLVAQPELTVPIALEITPKSQRRLRKGHEPCGVFRSDGAIRSER